jgi:hypothetical protein
MQQQVTRIAWQVLIGDAVLSGGDWPGDYRYWTSKEKADAHAASKTEAGWKGVSVIETDPPLHENMFPAKTNADQQVYSGPKGGRFTYGRAKNGSLYRRYF